MKIYSQSRTGPLSAIALLLIATAHAQDFTLQPLVDGPFRFKDVSGQKYSDAYIAAYGYPNASVNVSLDNDGAPYLSGTIQATGLKPNFAYQIKLAGRNTKLSGATGDDATNERIGLIGRWWRAQPNPANSDDTDYFAHKDNPNYIYSGYLVIGFFVTDAAGSANIHFVGDNSFHVLWRTNQRGPQINDGTVYTFTLPATAGNPAYDTSNPAQMLGIYGEWQPTRALPGTLVMPEAIYNCDFVLTEESFHDSGTNAGNWTAAMSASIQFRIGSGLEIDWSRPADIVYPTPLGDAQLNAQAPVPGVYQYSPTSGTVLGAGIHTLTLRFTPYDSTQATPGPVSVTLNVKQGTPRLEWMVPSALRSATVLDKTLLNATADVPGRFQFVPGLNSKMTAGTHELTAQFVPADTQNYSIPAPLIHMVDVSDGLLLSSDASAFPNPSFSNWPVQFSASSYDRSATFAWDFGDGTTGSGAMALHNFAAAGTYQVTVTCSASGKTETRSVTQIVQSGGASFSTTGLLDSDNDGFPDSLELAAGSAPDSPTSTPLNSTKPVSNPSLVVSKFSAQIGSGNYTVNLRAFMPLNAPGSLSYREAALSLGGMPLVFQLDGKGKCARKGLTVSARAHNKGARGGVDFAITASGLIADLPTLMSGPYINATSRELPVILVFGGQAHTAMLDVSVRGTDASAKLSK